MSSVCRICLAGNTRLYSLENNLLKDFYEKLSSAKFYAEDARPRVLCCLCYRKLIKCHTFFKIADRSEQIFTYLYDKGLQATHEYITEVNIGMKPQLTVTTMQFIIIDGNTTNANSQETIKYVPLPIIKIKKEATTKQDKWVAVESVLEDSIKNEIKSEDDEQGEDVEGLSYSIHDEKTKSEESEIIRCNTCNKIFFSESQLISHIKKSHFQLTGRQQACTKQYTENTSINTDEIINIKKNTFDCHVCGKEFFRKYYLNRHMTNHTGEKPFPCNVCDKKFTSKWYVVQHMRIHTKENKLICNICDKQYSNKQALVIHMRNHTGEKPYVCNVCDKQFKQNPHLTSHMRIHTGEKPFACNVCDKKFSHKKSLDVHMKGHTGVRPFVCNECDKQYRLKSDLVRHMRNHTGGKPLACNVCEKTFNENRDLARHLRIHTGEMPFACNVCDKKFNLKCNLVKHIRIHHM